MLAIEAVDGQAEPFVEGVLGLDHVVLLVALCAMLRTENRTQSQLAADSEPLNGMDQAAVNRSRIRNDPNAGTTERSGDFFQQYVQAGEAHHDLPFLSAIPV
jgi:hypothetical protein